MRKEGRMCNIYSRFTSEKNRSQDWRKKSRKTKKKAGNKEEQDETGKKISHPQSSQSFVQSFSFSLNIKIGSKRKQEKETWKTCERRTLFDEREREREREWMPSSTLPFIACYIMDWITSGVRESSNVVLVVELILWEKKKKRRVSDAFG